MIDVTFEIPRVDESLLVDYKIALNVVAQLEGSEKTFVTCNQNLCLSDQGTNTGSMSDHSYYQY